MLLAIELFSETSVRYAMVRVDFRYRTTVASITSCNSVLFPFSRQHVPFQGYKQSPLKATRQKPWSFLRLTFGDRSYIEEPSVAYNDSSPSPGQQ